MENNVIGLGGLPRAGKDTVAEYLSTQHGYTVIGMSAFLADALRILNPLIPLTIDGVKSYHPYSMVLNLLGYERAKTIPEVRRLLRVLGTDVVRDMIGEDTWVNMVEKSVQDALQSYDRVVVTGIRFPNELQMIRKLGGTALWVRGAQDRVDSTFRHSSDTSLSREDFDAELLNTGTMSNLYKAIDDMVRW